MYSFIYNSPLGALHINANEQHICSVRFGNKDSHSFNQNNTDATSPLQQTCQQQLDDYFENSL